MLEPVTGHGDGELLAAERAMSAAVDAYAAFDVEAVIVHLSAAVRGFTAAGRPCAAAMACARLGDAYASGLGNLTAARAWFARARRLVAAEPDCLEQGWVAVAAMGCDVDDPAELLAAAELALDRARRFGDVNLEAKALADAGLALVQAGDLVAGMAQLDEAMALAAGPADDADTAAKSVCSFFTACYYAADFERADAWATVLRRQGLIGPQPGGPVFLSSHCDSVQAALLCELGRWGEAEALLTTAIERFGAVMPMPAFHPAIELAGLRTRQGRLTDAEALLMGLEHHLPALLPAARLHAERGELDVAEATARRGLRLIGADRLRAAELLGVLVDVALARHDLEAAEQHVAEMARRVHDVDVPALRARADLARARVRAALGDLAGAITAAEVARDRIGSQSLPWLRATLLLALSGFREAAGDLALARRDAVDAAALLSTLDVVVPAADAARLARLTGVVGPGAPATLTLSGRWWQATWASQTVRLADSKGLRYLAELIAVPGVERHALDLVDRVEGVGDGPDRRALGHAGELLDARSRTVYRRRIADLRDEIDDLLARGDDDAAVARQAELDGLVRELARAFGIGGRARIAGSAAERARLNVTRALRTATARLADALPAAGSALDRHLRTGRYCVYQPDDDDIRWIVQSDVNGSAAR